MRRTFLYIALSVATLTGPALAGDVVAQSLGIAGRPIAGDGDWVVFEVWEKSQGAADLNGDGDAQDWVLHLLHVPTGTIENLGFTGAATIREPWLVITSNELFVRNLRSGQTTSLELPGTVNLTIHGNRIAVAVPETLYGRDLNGDGDVAQEAVAHVWDASTGDVQNLGLAASFAWLDAPRILLDDRFALFTVSEPAQGGTDFNGDGDLLDVVLHVHDFETGVTRPTRWVGEAFTLVDGQALIYASEADMAVDLDGNGLVEYGLHIRKLDLASLSAVEVPVRLDIGSSGPEWSEGERYAAFLAREYLTDLNADGDLSDSVPVMVDKRTGAVVNLGLATYPAPQPWSPERFTFSGDRLAVLVDEVAQGQVDLTGNGWVGDVVVHVFDPRRRRTHFAALPVDDDYLMVRSTSNAVVFAVREWEVGIDLNGDGDMFSDSVAHVLDAQTGEVDNLEIALASSCGLPQDPVAQDGRALLVVSEPAQGGADLNGDGDAWDKVLHVADLATGDVTSVGLAVSGCYPMVLSGRFAVFCAHESQGQRDLNGDGDALDYVMHVAGPLK